MRRMLKSIAMATLVGLFVAPSAVIAQGQDGVLGQDMNVVDIELDTIETTRKRLAWIKNDFESRSSEYLSLIHI